MIIDMKTVTGFSRGNSYLIYISAHFLFPVLCMGNVMAYELQFLLLTDTLPLNTPFPYETIYSVTKLTIS